MSLSQRDSNKRLLLYINTEMPRKRYETRENDIEGKSKMRKD